MGLKSELRNIKPNPAELRKFGLILGFLILVWTIFFAAAATALFTVLAVLILAVTIFLPGILKLIYLPMMFFAAIAGFFLFRIILTIIFFVILTPIRLLAYGIRKPKFPDPKARSYWKKHE